MPKLGATIVTGSARMLREGTPVEDYRERWGLWVKREDLACLPPGPPFSKTRGVYSHVAKRPESVIGVLDTSHSQAGHAVAMACRILGKKCINFYPHYKRDDGKRHSALREPQKRASELGASLHPLPAGRSCILYHAAKKHTEQAGGYMMPNALKLEESVEETAKEVNRTRSILRNPLVVLIPASSGTIAAGVIRGFGPNPTYIVHMGYSRSVDELRSYLVEKSGVRSDDLKTVIINEGYAYKDQARHGATPAWPCNTYYDLKAFRWWVDFGRERFGEALLWNIG